MTYNVFGGTLNPAQSNPVFTEKSQIFVFSQILKITLVHL